MRRYLVVQSYRGSNLTRNKYRDAAVTTEHASVDEPYFALDALAEAYIRAGYEDDAANCYVVDVQRRPVERPREVVQ